MTRFPRSPLDGPTLGYHLQWHAGQRARRGIRCSVLVLRPLGHADQALLAPLPGHPASLVERPSTLSQVAERLRPLLRCNDVVEVEERLGVGVLLYDADEEGARVVCERLRRELAQMAFDRLPGGAVVEDLHLAVGCSTAEPTDAGRIPALVRELAEDAVTPDLCLSVPLMHIDAHEPGAEAVRRDARIASRKVARSLRGGTDQPAPYMLPPELEARGATVEGAELRHQADALGVPYVYLLEQVAPSLRRFIPAELAAEVCAVPIGLTRSELTGVMRDPVHQCAVPRLRRAGAL